MRRTLPEKRIVLATFGSLGDLQPFLAISTELRARGHVPVVATSEMYRGIVTAADLEYAPVRPDRQPGQQDPDFLDRLWRERENPADMFREMFLPALRDSLHDLLQATQGADAVVSHTLVSAARLAAESHRLVWVSTVMQPMGYLSAHEPPIVGPPWVAATLRALGPWPTSRLLQVARRMTALWTTEWHHLRAELELPATTDQPLWEGQHAPRRSLGLFPRVLGSPQADWPPQARVTGSPFFRPPDRALDPHLEHFLAAGEAPLVFTLGTTAVNDAGNFYEQSAEAARRLGMRAVLVQRRAAQGQIPDQSGDIIAVPYAAHDLLFPRAAVIVHQGGIGTLSEALLAGKPMLIMPYAHDQADNAWRATRLGVARIVPRRRYRANVVRRSLARLLNDYGYGAAVARISQAVARDRGAVAAADFIEAALS